MENGELNDTFRGLTVNDAKDDNLSKVLKAVQAAEATIRQQAEDNNRLRVELQQRDQKLEDLKVDKTVAQRYYSFDTSDEHRQRVDKAHQAATFDPLSTLVLHQDLMPKSDAIEYNHFSVSRGNGNLSTLSGGQTPANARFSQLSSPSATLFSPGRFPNDREYDPHTNGPAQGWMQVSESEDQSRLQQQIREHEEEIMQLRRHLTHYSVKEAQIRNEKCVLENRIAHMRMAFDQQQQEVVNATSKALSYRQDIIEENVRLACALQDAQQERTTFVSSLLPLLAEYSLQPQVSDAQAIVSNIKLLFRHLQENLIITEARLKESQYQLTPWRSDQRDTKFASQSQGNFSGAALISSAIGLELVPRPTYSPVNLANSDAIDWELRRQNAFQGRAGGSQNSKVDNMGSYSPFASRDSYIHDVSAEVAVNRDDLRATYNRQVQFKHHASSSEVDGAAADLHHNESEYPGAWGSDTSPYSNTYEDSNPACSPYLQPVLEEPSSSFSEAAEDDILPAIEGLQISGEAYPGRELQACGYSVNGTTSCNFEWVRHLEDGSVNYIDGAKQPVYLVTADDVEAYLAIEVQPLDDRKRKGDIVKVFANDHRKIACDPAMSSHIEQNLRNGHASYSVFLSTGYLDIWQPATLNIKREGYSIKGSGSNAVTANEKFLPGTLVTITYGQDIEFSIFNPNGDAHLLQAQNYIPDIMSLRDTIVLLLRSFIMKAAENGKGRRRRVRFFSR